MTGILEPFTFAAKKTGCPRRSLTQKPTIQTCPFRPSHLPRIRNNYAALFKTVSNSRMWRRLPFQL